MVIAAFVCKVGLHACHGAVGFLSLDPHQRPGTGADVNRIVIIGRDRQHCGAGIMCGWKHHRTVKSDLFPDFFCKVPNHRPGHGYGPEHFGIAAQHVDQLIIPVVGPGIYQLGAGGIGIFHLLYTGQQKIKIVRNHQDRLRLLQIFGV